MVKNREKTQKTNKKNEMLKEIVPELEVAFGLLILGYR